MKKTNQRLLSPLLLLLAAMALLAFGVFTNVLTDLWGPGIKEQFQHNAWLIAAFALLLAFVGYLYANQSSRAENAAPEAIDADQYDEAFVKFKALLLEQYQLRLNSKTGKRLPINLSAKSTQYGFDPARADIFLGKQTIESQDIAAEIDQILARHNRLLLIGDPGAGKTTILLYAAVNILNHAQEAKLPLILNLATWQDDRNFQDWYAQSIAHTYSLSLVFVAELLRRNAIVPFFDGFDEVAETYRDDCFQKMTAYFGDQRSRQLIVSSRKKEYAAAQADAPVYAELEVLPLSLPQIKSALSENALSHASDQALLDALHRDEHLAKAVETPFYLNTASFLFGKSLRTWADFPFKADDTEGRQVELVEIFVAEQVPEERDRKYLGFLAGKMEEEGFLVFELVKMQPYWCGKVWLWRLTLGVCLGGLLGFVIVFGLFGYIGILLGAHMNLDNLFSLALFQVSLLSSVVTALLFALILVSIKSFTTLKLSTQEIQGWHGYLVVKNWRVLFAYLVFFSFIGLLIIYVGLSFFSDGHLTFEWFHEWDYIRQTGLLTGIVFGLCFGIKKSGTTFKNLLYIPSAYQRFWATFQISFWIVPTLILALLCGQVRWIIEGNGHDPNLENFVALIILVPSYLVLALSFSLLPLFSSKFLHHFALRLVLYLENKLPLRVVTFLDRMTDQHIFEDNRRMVKGKKMRGATWRFRHKILQDYFAGIAAK